MQAKRHVLTGDISEVVSVGVGFSLSVGVSVRDSVGVNVSTSKC